MGSMPLCVYLFGSVVKKQLITQDKPFRRNSPTDPKFIVANPRNFDEEKKEITKNGKYIKLTAGEYEVLLLLLKREGFIVSREDIFENSDILNQDYESSGSLAVIINRIRHKIEENPKEPKFLHTIRGLGYKFIQ